MKHKVSKIKRIALSILAVVCALSSTAAISASAASNTKYAEMSNGYTVSSYTGYSGVSTTGIGTVTNGGPCSIKVWTYGYYKSGSYVKLSCNAYDSINNNKSLTVNTSGNYNLIGSKCISTFNSATTVSVTAGTVS